MSTSKKSQHQNDEAALNEALPTVLIVDDEELILRTFSRALSTLSVRVVTATSALHALSFLQQHPVALVLSDNRMPGPSGIELLDTVRLRWPETKRVLMSAFLDHEVALLARHHRVVPKYMNTAMLRDIIEQETRRAG